MAAPKPHVSTAVQALRRWVIFCSMLVVTACLTQMLVFGVTHYTGARHTTLEAPPPKQLKVVQTRPLSLAQTRPEPNESGAAPLLGPGAVMDAKEDTIAGVKGESVKLSAAVEPNRVLSVTDQYMRSASRLASVAGALSILALAFVVALGTIIAGGGGIPGVEKSVSASVWAAVLALFVLPWKDAMPSLPVPGVFSGYDTMAATSEAVNAAGGAGGMMMHVQWVAIPFVATLCALMVAFWYHRGVQQGIIIQSVSELDRQIEREVAQIQKRGLGLSAPRTLGALNRAIGDSTEESLTELSMAAAAPSPAREPRNFIEPINDRPPSAPHPGRLI